MLIPCPVCHSSSFSHYLTASCPRRSQPKEYDLVKCDDCSFIFLNPFPTVEELATCYDSGYEDLWGKTRSLKQEVEYLMVKRLPRKPPGKLLDVGSGTGAYLAKMEGLGWDVTGVDAFAHGYTGRQIHPKVINTDLKNAYFPPESFDIVTSWWAIEHIPKPLDELKLMRRIIKPDGLLAVGTSNIMSWEAKLFGKYWHHLVLPDHCCQFSPETLSSCLKRASFQPIVVRHTPFTGSIIGGLDSILKERGLNLKMDGSLLCTLGIPFEIIAALFRRSGLFTIFAKPI